MARALVERFVRRRAGFRGRVIDFFDDEVRLPNGRLASREYVGHPGAVAVLPVLACGDVVLVRQYRYPVRRVTYEVPAGKLGPREAAAACLRRELREETGYSAGRVRRLLSYWTTPAFSDEVLHVYVADRLRPGPVSPDEDEFVETVRVPFRRALGWVFSGKVRDSKTVIALLAYALKGEKL